MKRFFLTFFLSMIQGLNEQGEGRKEGEILVGLFGVCSSGAPNAIHAGGLNGGRG